MKCLSIMQPYASLILAGMKQYETRHWRTSHRGPLGIHASRRTTDEITMYCQREPLRSAIRKLGSSSREALPTGAILGYVTLIDCLPTHLIPAGDINDFERAAGDFRSGRFAWHLTNPVFLEHPILMSGRPSIFDAPFTINHECNSLSLPFLPIEEK